MPRKPGRPRHRNPGKWASYKRQQREMPGKPGHVRHHVEPGTYGPPGKAKTVLVSRSAHAAIHNRLRKKRKKLRKH